MRIRRPSLLALFPTAHVISLAALSLFGVLATKNARADSPGFSMNRFEPSEKGSEWFSQDSLDLRGSGRPAFGIVGDLAIRRQRLVQDARGPIPADKLSFISSQAFVHVGASLVLFDRIRIGAELPILVTESGNDITRDGVRYTPPQGRGVGDPRLGVDVRLILPESQPIIDAVAKVLRDNPKILKVRVEGHTDNNGTAKYNEALSRRRAAAVVLALGKAGVDKKRLSSAGFGLTRPLDTNDTEEGRANNRRVEFHIVEGLDAEVPAATVPAS